MGQQSAAQSSASSVVPTDAGAVTGDTARPVDDQTTEPIIEAITRRFAAEELGLAAASLGPAQTEQRTLSSFETSRVPPKWTKPRRSSPRWGALQAISLEKSLFVCAFDMRPLR